jgi:acyl dehydratase
MSTDEPVKRSPGTEAPLASAAGPVKRSFGTTRATRVGRRAGALDFDAVRVGDALPELRKTVTVDQIRAYAAASGDRNPIHLDDEFARRAGLPGVIAHGMLTMAFVNQLVTDWLGNRAGVSHLQGRFSGMVLPGDEVRCTGTVSIKDDSRRRITLSLAAVNQRGERVFTKGIAEAQV